MTSSDLRRTATVDRSHSHMARPNATKGPHNHCLPPLETFEDVIERARVRAVWTGQDLYYMTMQMRPEDAVVMEPVATGVISVSHGNAELLDLRKRWLRPNGNG